MSGWIKMHRKTLDNPVVCKDSDHLAVWSYLLLNATHKEYPAVFAGEKITLQPGQLITGRKAIAEKFNISESKVQRILKSFEIEHQIEQQSSNKNRLVTMLSWDEYQSNEQQDELPVNNKRTTTEQQVNTNKNVKNKKNVKNEINKELIVEIINYLNEVTGKSFSSETKESIKLISGRLTEGRTIEQFRHVIDVKASEWLLDEKMNAWLKPNTLFAQSNFESYMNQKLVIIGGGNSGKHGKGNERTLATNGYDKSELESLYIGSPVRVQQVSGYGNNQ